MPKLNYESENGILKKLLKVETKVSHFIGRTNHKVYYRTTGGLYWKVFTDFAPSFNINGVAGSSSRETSFSLSRGEHVQPLIGILSSNLFWWWYTISSNLRDLNPIDIQSFPVSKALLDSSEVTRISKAYLKDLVKNSTMLVRQQRQTGRTETQSFKIQKSKPLIDEIDRTIAACYGLNGGELDFIVNYDVKFRLGSDEDGPDE